MIVIIVSAAIGFAYLNFVGEPDRSRTGSSSVLTGRVTHVRDGDTIVVGVTPIRFANLDCAELGTAAGEIVVVGGDQGSNFVSCRIVRPSLDT